MIEKILLVTRVYPPSANPEALCTGKLAFALGEAGVKVTVVTLEGNEAKWQDDTIDFAHRNVAIIRVPGCTGRWAQRVGTYLRSWWNVRTSLPDAFSVQVLAESVRALVSSERFDLIYGRGFPAAGFLAGCLAAESSGVPWVCHLSDPWPRFLLPEPYRRQLFRFRNLWNERRWLRRITHSAIAISVPSRKMVGYLTSRSPQYARSKFMVVPHVSHQTPDGPSTEWRPTKGPTMRLSVAYTGTIGSNRDVRPLFRAARQVLDGGSIDFELTFMVPEMKLILRMCEQYGLGATVRCIEPGSYHDARRLAANADALLLIEANTPEGLFLPSKFIDYCSSGKPILALTPDGSEVSQYLREGGGLAVPPTDRDKIAEAIKRLCGDYRNSRLGDLGSSCLLKHFAPAHVVKGFIEGVENLLPSYQTVA